MKPEDLDRFPDELLISVYVFSFFFEHFSAKLLQILVKWHYQPDRISPVLFILNYARHLWGWGHIWPSRKIISLVTPDFYTFFLKGIIIVHEIIITSQDFQLQIF